MRTRVTERGQVSIPAEIRRSLGIAPNSEVEWIVESGAVRMLPIPKDPIAALRGSGKTGAVARLLDARREDRETDDRR